MQDQTNYQTRTEKDKLERWLEKKGFLKMKCSPLLVLYMTMKSKLEKMYKAL